MYYYFSQKKLYKITFKYLILVFLIIVKNVNGNNVEITSYSKVATNSNDGGKNQKNSVDTSKIYRLDDQVMNLWFPQVFNQTQPSTTLDVSTGRAASIDTRPFPFPLANTVSPNKQFGRTQNYKSSSPTNHKMEYGNTAYYNPSARERPAKYKSQKSAMDRFSPSEAVATSQIKMKLKQQKQYEPPKRQTQDTVPLPKPTIVNALPPTMASYIPPKDLYAFPPNIYSNYEPPKTSSKIEDAVSSYLPPAAGPVYYPDSFNSDVDTDTKTNTQEMETESGPNPNENIDDTKSPSNDDHKSNHDESGDNMHKDSSSDQDMPQSSGDEHMMNGHDHMHDDHDHDHEHDHDHDHEDEHDHDHDDEHNHDHDHDHEHDHNYDHDSVMEIDHPPTYHDHIPDVDHLPWDHDNFELDHHHHHDFGPYSDFSYSSGPGSHGIDAYPEVIYDHDPHHHIETTTTTTTPAPPPPPPEPEERPRVKQYSYFYIGRKLWYIPLYFTVWFTFYITYLICLSIGRHKVDLPNHLVNRRSVRDVTHKETVNKVNRLTEFVMTQIEDFKDKYL